MDSKDQNPTNGTLSDDELKSLNGREADSSNDAINLLHQEIASLRKDRSELQGKIAALLSEMEHSEVQTKAVAAHASYLEGELVKTQEDLISASSLAEDAENEKKIFENESKELRSEVTVLKDKITDLEVERGRKDGEIRILSEKIRTLEEKKVTLEAEIETMKENEKARASKEGVLEQMVKVLKEKNSELEEGLVSSMGKREQELQSTIIELKEKNLKLEGMLKEEVDLNQKSREMNVAAATANCDAGINWGVVAAAAASTGTVAVAATMLCLRQKQR